MKDAKAIQFAHDVLCNIVCDEGLRAAVAADGSLPFIVAALDVLCWVLEHEHNTTFAGNLEKLQAFLDLHGVRLIDAGRPMSLQEFLELQKGEGT